MTQARDLADNKLTGDVEIDGTTLTVDSTNNRVGIGTDSPSANLDVVDGGTYSGIRVSNTANNTTNKVGHYTGRHYTNAEENVLGLRISSVAGSNDVVIGGGSGLLNAATSIQFYTAANTTTLSGTEAARFNPSGNLAFPNGQGIDFSASTGGSASSSILDDYEEGTWTPVFGAASFTQTGASFSNARYIKIGDLVFYGFTVNFSGTSGNWSAGDGFYLAGGAPFINSTFHSAGSCWASAAWTSGLRATGIVMAYSGNQAYIGIEQAGAISRNNGLYCGVTFRI